MVILDDPLNWLKCNAVFTLDICVYVCLNVTVKHKDGFRPILCIFVCVSIDTMLNVDGDIDANADANVKCEHSITCNFPGVLPFSMLAKYYLSVMCATSQEKYPKMYKIVANVHRWWLEKVKQKWIVT